MHAIFCLQHSGVDASGVKKMKDANTQRVQALIQGESVFPPVASFFGHKHGEEQNPATLIAHLVRLQRAYDWDFVKVQSRATYYGEAWGCVHTYDDATGPVMVDHVVKTIDDYYRLDVLDVTAGPLAEHVEVAKGLADAFQGGVPHIHTVFSPLTVLSRLGGAQRRTEGETVRLLQEIERFPDAVRHGLDFEPIVQAFYTQSLLGVRKELQIHTVKEYIDFARAHPDQLMFAAPGGLGGINNMWGAWLHAETGTRVTYVNYKGAAEATGDLMTGRVDATFGSLTFMAPFIKEGKLVPLAVGGKARSPLFPDVPTIVEAGILPEFDAVYWVGYVAPHY